MKKQGAGPVGIVFWLVGIIVSLAVGFGLISGSLAVPYIGPVNQITGWIVVIGTVINVILAIFSQ